MAEDKTVGRFHRKEIPTVSIAIASSVIDNAQTAELATSLSGQIARTAAIFNVDEVVVLDETPDRSVSQAPTAIFQGMMDFAHFQVSSREILSGVTAASKNHASLGVFVPNRKFP